MIPNSNLSDNNYIRIIYLIQKKELIKIDIDLSRQQINELLIYFAKESANLNEYTDDYIKDFMNILVNSDSNPVSIFYDTLRIILETRPALAKKIKTEISKK